MAKKKRKGLRQCHMRFGVSFKEEDQTTKKSFRQCRIRFGVSPEEEDQKKKEKYSLAIFLQFDPRSWGHSEQQGC